MLLLPDLTQKAYADLSGRQQQNVLLPEHTLQASLHGEGRCTFACVRACVCSCTWHAGKPLPKSCRNLSPKRGGGGLLGFKNDGSALFRTLLRPNLWPLQQPRGKAQKREDMAMTLLRQLVMPHPHPVTLPQDCCYPEKELPCMSGNCQVAGCEMHSVSSSWGAQEVVQQHKNL